MALTSMTTQAARLPSPERVQKISQKFFDRYGKKFPETVFGQHNTQTIQINSIHEVSYHVAYADVALLFKDGRVGRALVKLDKKFPKSWRVISWEMLQLAGR